MRVRMRVSKAGLALPHYGISGTFSLAAGDVVDLHEELAEKWLASGHAEIVEEPEAKKTKRGKTVVSETESD